MSTILRKDSSDQAWHETADLTAFEEPCGHGQWSGKWRSCDLKIRAPFLRVWTNIRPPVPSHNQEGLVWYKNPYSNWQLTSLVREKASSRLDAILQENKKPSEIFLLLLGSKFYIHYTDFYHTRHACITPCQQSGWNITGILDSHGIQQSHVWSLISQETI